MEKIIHTYCRVCEPNCGLKATVIDGKLTKITGDKEHPVSKGYICARGLATLDIHHDPDRIKYPQKKVNGGFQNISWDAALLDIGEKIKSTREKYGKDSVAIYFGNPIAFDFAFSVFLQMAIQTLGSKNIYSAGSQDCNNKMAAAQPIFGSPVLHPVPDVDNMEFLIIWGSNPAVSKMSFISLTRPEERIKAIEERGGRVIIIDPRRTETARHVGEHIYIRPDTDIFMLLAMLHVILKEELYDRTTVNNHTKNVDHLKKLAAEYPPERAAEVTGIDKEVISALARDFANAKNAGIHSSLGINLASHGTLGYWLVQCLNAVTGRLDRKGSMIFCDPVADFSKMSKRTLENETSKKRQPRLSRIGNFTHIGGTYPAGILADEILTPGENQIKALIVISGNPMLTVPDPQKLEKALKSLDVLVSLDLFINETGGLSQYVLPCQDFYEHWDFTLTSSMFNPVRHINYTDKVVDALGERKEIWVILHDILCAAGYPFIGNKTAGKIAGFLDSIGKLLKRTRPFSYRPKLLLKILLLMGKVSWRKLKRSPNGLMLPPHKTGNFFKSKILTSDKKLDLAPEQFIAEADVIAQHFEKEKKYEGFKLINQRQKRTHNSWFHNVASFVEKMQTNMVSINEKDAKNLSISQGDMVEVKSATGVIHLPAKVVDDLMPGVISIPHGWGHDKSSGLSNAKKYPGVNVNLIIASGPESLEKFAGMAKMTGVPVTIEKV